MKTIALARHVAGLRAAAFLTAGMARVPFWKFIAADAGAAALLYTDIRRDGTQQGPNLEALEAVARATPTPVIASGGISTREHVRAASRIAGVEAAIVGQALYQGTLTLREATEAAEGNQ